MAKIDVKFMKADPTTAKMLGSTYNKKTAVAKTAARAKVKAKSTKKK